MKCKYGKLPEFTAEEINELSALARDMEYYADIKGTILKFLNNILRIASEKQFKFLWAIKNELRERLEDY